MGFVLRCPKCESTNVAMFMDRQLRWSGNRDGERVLSCRACGKMLYGAAATAELDRQQEADARRAPTVPSPPSGPSDAEIQAQIRRNLATAHHKILTDARAEIRTLLTKARAEGARVAAVRKDIPRTSPLYCNINLIAIGLASVERISGELDRALSPSKVTVNLDEARAIVNRLPTEAKSVLSAPKAMMAPPVEPKAVPATRPPIAPKGKKLCVWTGCKKQRREGSEYCSNDCRIKKARYTYDIKRGRIKITDPRHTPPGR